MRRGALRMLLVAGLLALLAWPAGLAGPRSAAAQTAEPVKIRVRITDNGFDDKDSGWSISVEQGQVVELTFFWDQKEHTADEHIFVLDAYNLEWKTINAQNREATQRFVADKPGAFRIKCDLDCEIHDRLKNGILNVSRGGGPAAGAAGRAKPQIGITAPIALNLGDVSRIAVNVADASGKPIAGGVVRLVEMAGFMGTPPQEVQVAASRTGKDGVATLIYQGRRLGDRALKVYFDGDASTAAGSLDLKLKVNDGPPVYEIEPPAGIPGVNQFLVSGILIIVWGTMFIVAAHVVALAREGQRAEASGQEGRDG